MNKPQNERMDASRPQLWERYWGGSKRMTPIDMLVWWARSLYSLPTSKLLRESLAGVDKPRIFEVGCGSATTTRDLFETMPTGALAGLDIVPGPLQIARQRIPHLVAHVADARRIPVADGAFDLVFSVGLIEHFSREVAAEFVREHMRVTRAGGKVAVTVPNGASPMDLIRKVMGPLWPFGVEHPFAPAELQAFFESVGLSDCRVHVIKSYRLLAVGTVR